MRVLLGQKTNEVPLVLRVQQVLRVLKVLPGLKANEVPLVLKGLLVRREILV